ncbi:hypothetical protein BKA62DRAFT_680695 [Auriculariales sp. MPI-PUGE-AT-0066]|nr:hypothetical protein BKA62DRAFT_680695 [Auriculariales sp. MPI-PUGE-AT-0066]
MFHALSAFSIALAGFRAVSAAPAADPCATIAGVTWAAPADVLKCFQSIPLNETLRTNIVDNVSKTFQGFHTSTNWYLKAPAPFQNDVHVDLIKEFDRIAKQKYSSYYAFHKDIQDVVKLGRDGHAGVTNLCFDSLFVTYSPFPLVVLESPLGSIGSIHIAPEASKVVAAEFPDQIDFWKSVKGLNDLASFDGATVLLIDGKDPWAVVDANAAVQGGHQGLSTRQGAFFSSYTVASAGWTYRMGDFAAKALPTSNQVTLTVLKKGAILPTTVTVPYRSRIGTGVVPWTDAASLFAGNCLATASVNGIDYYPNGNSGARVALPAPGREQYLAPPVNPADRERAQNVESGSELLFDVVLPPELQPTSPISGSGAMQFYQLDSTTGVLALGSFSGTFSVLESGLLAGLQDLKSRGVTKLVVDLTNNGGGFICIAHWLHRIIAGANPHTVPLAALNTTIRATPLARKIVDKIVAGGDPSNRLLYNSLGWKAANNTEFPEFYNWLTPGNPRVVNGRQDAFGDAIGDECQPFDAGETLEALFDTKNVLIVNNGRCSSSCSLFTISMSVNYGTRSVVVGGKPNTKQQYCGTVGGQSTSYVTMDTQVKTTKLKSDALSPPDLLAAVSVGITWRLGYSIRDPTNFEEWKDHTSTFSYTPTAETVNNPTAIWKALAQKYLA